MYCSILFRSVLFYSLMFYHNPSFSVLFYSLLYSVWFFSVSLTYLKIFIVINTTVLNLRENVISCYMSSNLRPLHTFLRILCSFYSVCISSCLSCQLIFCFYLVCQFCSVVQVISFVWSCPDDVKPEQCANDCEHLHASPVRH